MSKIGAFLNPFCCTDDDRDFEGMHIGAKVATIEMVKNIITYGCYDGYHFPFGREDHSDEQIEKYIKQQGWDPTSILIYDGGAIPLDDIKHTDYHSLIRLDAGIDVALSLRNALNIPIAPAIGFIHTVAYAHLNTLWTELLLGHVLPCDAMICSSRASKEALIRTLDLLGERLAAHNKGSKLTFQGLTPVIPLGIDTNYWKPTEDKSYAKKLQELPEQSCVIICPARFSTYDKMDLRPFLLVIKRLASILGPNYFKVVLVGDDLRQNDGDNIRQYVDLLGVSEVVKIDADGSPLNIRRYYDAADIFVSLADSIQETFGLTVIEAMACGLPTIVSDWNGYKDTVIHQETGLRIRTYWAECDRQISDLSAHRHWMVNQLLLSQSVAIDVKELYESLYYMIISPDMRDRYGKAGRKRAEQQYSWPIIIKQYRELWDECHKRFRTIEVQEWAKSKQQGLLSQSYFHRFMHYPSEIISPETQLELLPDKFGLTPTNDLIKTALLPSDMNSVFPGDVFENLKHQLSDWPIKCGQAVENVAKETGHTEDLIVRQIMWLIKYGMVKPIDATPNKQSVVHDVKQVNEVVFVVD